MYPSGGKCLYPANNVSEEFLFTVVYANRDETRRNANNRNRATESCSGSPNWTLVHIAKKGREEFSLPFEGKVK
jgi:hypothetical protein